MKANEIKDRVLEVLNGKEFIPLFEIEKYIEEAKGEYDYFMPMKDGYNQNILWASKLSQETIKSIHELILEDKINWNPIPLTEVMFQGYKMISLRPFKKPMVKTQTKCWMPILISIKEI
jgi:hypothetical protein